MKKLTLLLIFLPCFLYGQNSSIKSYNDSLIDAMPDSSIAVIKYSESLKHFAIWGARWINPNVWEYVQRDIFGKLEPRGYEYESFLMFKTREEAEALRRQYIIDFKRKLKSRGPNYGRIGKGF